MDTREVNLKVNVNIKENQDMTFLALSFLLSAVFLYFLVGPVFVQKAAVEKGNLARQEDLKSKRDLLLNIESFNNNNKDLSVNSKKLIALLPNRDNTEDYFNQVKILAAKNNLQLVSFKPKDVDPAQDAPAQSAGETAAAANPSPDEPKFNQKEIEIIMKGNYGTLQSFLKSLENGIPFMKITFLNIAVAEKENQTIVSGNPLSPDPNPALDIDMKFRFTYY